MSDTWLFLYCIKGVALFLMNRLNIAESAQISLLFKSEISSLYPSSVAVQPSLYQTWSEGFLTTRLSCVKCVVHIITVLIVRRIILFWRRIIPVLVVNTNYAGK